MIIARRSICSCFLPLAVLLTVMGVPGVGTSPAVAADRVVLCEEFTSVF
jgi:hypothetical protein